MGERVELTREFLMAEYIGNNKTLKELVAETGWASNTISVRLREFGISKRKYKCDLGRGDGRLLTREYLLEHYVALRKSTYQIATELGISPCSVSRRLKRHGVEIRSVSDYHEDLTDKRFGKLLVLQSGRGGPSNKGQYLCLCDCGRQKWVRRDRLAYGSNISCGCEEAANRSGIGERSKTGYMEISGTFWSAICGRARRGKGITITIEQAWELYEKQGRRCALTGVCIAMPPTGDSWKRKGSALKFASLDRIDSAKGYHPDNCQWTWWPINRMKWDMSQEQFLALCKAVTEYAACGS